MASQIENAEVSSYYIVGISDENDGCSATS
jgi:hypothetical protein